MQHIVSIIVPVYNVEKFLPSCINSVLKQTSPQWELILVDDGSSDASGRICDDFAIKDQRIKVFHKSNGGVSSARNYGIKNAVGEWVTFLDADDAFCDTAIEFILECIGDCDILRFGMKEIYANSEKIFHIYSTENRNVYLSRVIGYKDIVSVWGGAYRKKLFEENAISFDESLVKAEDWKVLFLLAKNASRIRSIDEPLYLYNKNNVSSCTSSLSYKKEFDSLKVFQFICDNTDSSEGMIKESLQEIRLKLYHKIISTIAIVEKNHIGESFRKVRTVQRMLGIVSLKNFWNTGLSVSAKIVDCLSLYWVTFPLFQLVYYFKYRK